MRGSNDVFLGPPVRLSFLEGSKFSFAFLLFFFRLPFPSKNMWERPHTSEIELPPGKIESCTTMCSLKSYMHCIVTLRAKHKFDWDTQCPKEIEKSHREIGPRDWRSRRREGQFALNSHSFLLNFSQLLSILPQFDRVEQEASVPIWNTWNTLFHFFDKDEWISCRLHFFPFRKRVQKLIIFEDCSSTVRMENLFLVLRKKCWSCVLVPCRL